MAIADYLRKLVELRNQLVVNLKSMGVVADESEKLNTLVPKVLECKTEQNVEFVEGTTNFTSLQTHVKKVTIPDNVTSIGARAFKNCESLVSITIPNGVTSIGDYVFSGCPSLTSITIPNGVTSIGGYAFEYCSSLTSITIPNNVTSIGRGAFKNCESLVSITIPNGVTSIGSSAFRECPSLTSITIPNGVTSIGDYAFRNCESLSDIYYTGTSSQWSSITKGNNWNYNMGSNVSGGTKIHYNYIPE